MADSATTAKDKVSQDYHDNNVESVCQDDRQADGCSDQDEWKAKHSKEESGTYNTTFSEAEATQSANCEGNISDDYERRAEELNAE